MCSTNPTDDTGVGSVASVVRGYEEEMPRTCQSWSASDDEHTLSGYTTCPEDQHFGVPQGDVSSPLNNQLFITADVHHSFDTDEYDSSLDRWASNTHSEDSIKEGRAANFKNTFSIQLSKQYWQISTHII